MKAVTVADFSTLPGPRHTDEGPNSGEEFREKHLLPAFREADKAGEKLLVYLDGVRFGYPTSFLEEAFGGLARIVGIEQALQGLEFHSTDEPLLIDEIKRYILNANKTSSQRAAG
jgi:hypothetical protein